MRTGGIWPVLFLLAATGLAFWFSLFTSISAGLDTPIGLAPAAVPLALAAAGLAYQRDGRPAPGRDGFTDGAAGLVLIAVALGLVWSGPRSGWTFWSNRQDLLALELFALGAACWMFGVGAVWRYRWAAAVLVVASPPVLGWLDEHLAPLLAAATSLAARPVDAALGVHFSPGTAGTTFRGVDRFGQAYDILITDACSGISSWLSVVLLGIPAAAYLGLKGRALARWMALGLGLASVVNWLRVVVLLLATDRWGVTFALGVLHPVLGLVLVVAMFLALFFGARRRPALERGWTVGPLKPGVALGVALFALGGALGQVGLLPFGALPASGVAGRDVASPLDVIPRLPGWSSQVIDEISWQNLFGNQSRSLALTYSSPGHPIVTAQVVTTPEQGRLLQYTPERCGVYHGEQVRGQRTVDLGLGQVGYLIDTVDEVPKDRAHADDGETRPLRFDVLYWYVPFTVNQNHWFARFTLILDGDADAELPAPAAIGLAPGGAEFERVDAELVNVGQNLVARLAA